MAIVKGWLKKSKGKFMGATLYNAGGDTILREVVTPKNPKTDSQMLQRIKFAAMVEFYKRAIQALFKFAFEDKKRKESDYNAFVRENMAAQVEIFPTREYFKNINAGLVAPWVMTKGTLPALGVTYNSSDVCIYSNISLGDSAVTSWSQFLALNPHVQMGDIITGVRIISYVKMSGGQITVTGSASEWSIIQVIVGESLGTGNVDALFQGRGFSTYKDSKDKIWLTLALDQDGTVSEMGTFILSRKTANGLEVCDSSLVLNDYAQEVYNYLKANEAQALSTWGANGEAVLQGSVAKNAQ